MNKNSNLIILDLIAQAKSGTGKTLVFAIAALESLKGSLIPEIMILSPTREIAVQSYSIIQKIGHFKSNLYCKLFIGGLSLEKDIQNLSPCNIVVGTPGRIKKLKDMGFLLLENIKMIVIDESDKMFEGGALQDDTINILKSLNKCQILSFSATYSKNNLNLINKYINDAQHIVISGEELSLDGVKQYYSLIDVEESKVSNKTRKNIIVPALTKQKIFQLKLIKLFEILSRIAFHQCIVFCNDNNRVSSLVEKLNVMGWASSRISSHLNQKQRIYVINQLRKFEIRILVSSDLTARGLDIEFINLVVNLDLPFSSETYLHRIGRTGRFGSYGIAINIVDYNELETLLSFVQKNKCSIENLPDTIPPEFYLYDMLESEKQFISEKIKEIGQKSDKKRIFTHKEKISKRKKKSDKLQNFNSFDLQPPPAPPLSFNYADMINYMKFIESVYLKNILEKF